MTETPDVHVMPDDETHDASPFCWCQPVIDAGIWPLKGHVYVHRRTIDGPVYESAE